MPEFLQNLFSSGDFMPHGHCYLWNPGLVWLHVTSDALISLAYTSIPFTLVYLARKRRDIPFNWMFFCFGMFIIACGATHVMEIWTLWTPTYWLSGSVKAITAMASVPTAVLLVKLVPQALAIPTAEQLSKAHEELRKAHEVLETRVRERTAELTQKNEELAREIVERKHAEEALRKSEARFRRLADAGIIGIVTADIHGNILDANDPFLKMVDYTRDEVLSGKVRWADMTPPEWRHLDELAIGQLQATGIAPAWEKEYVRKDGSRVPILVGAAMLEGSARECIAFILDLTERKRAEEALVRSERRFRRLEESGIIGIVLSDTAGNISEANDAFLSVVGYSREDLLAGRISGKNLNTPDRERTDALARAQLQANGMAYPWEKELVRKDGSRVPVLSGVVMLDETADKSMAFILDLTERKRAEAAVGQSEARKAAVMEAALDAIVMMDHEGKITEFDHAAEETFGYSGAEAIGTPLVDLLIPPSLRDKHKEDLRRYLETGQGPILGKRIEVTARRKDGSEFPAEVAVVRIRSEGPTVFTGYIRDVTERRQAAEAEMLRRAKEAAEEANAELEAFSYSVAHDLRAPLRGINGFSSALLEDWGDRFDAEAKEHLGRIISGAERMAQLIDALLALARLTRTEPRRETVDLTQLAQKVIDQLRATDSSRKATFAVASGLATEGDPQLLQALFENLLGNAWKFTSKRSEGRIEFGREEVDGAPSYYVRDNGVGFDMNHVTKLFAPFRRLHSNEDYEGTGIGLATVQRIVRRHGGRVWAEGVENQGATFRFTLSTAQPGGGQ